MRDRTKSLKRVLAVQQQIVRLAEWRLGILKQQCNELKADRQRLHEFVSAGDHLSPLLSTAAFKTGQSLASATARREQEVKTQTGHTDTMRRREKLAEQLVDKAVAEREHEAEKKQLQETIEAANWRDGASFP